MKEGGRVGQDGGGQGGQIKRVIFVGTQAAIINVTDETASRELCKLLHLGLRDNRLPRKTYGYGRPFFISLAATVTISSPGAGHRRRRPRPRKRKEERKMESKRERERESAKRRNSREMVDVHSLILELRETLEPFPRFLYRRGSYDSWFGSVEIVFREIVKMFAHEANGNVHVCVLTAIKLHVHFCSSLLYLHTF